jgi:purine-binding chemotaxis protein CheW
MTVQLNESGAKAAPGKYLTFNLSNETYGVAVKYVREILAVTAITAVPNTPKFIKGVMNLRGKIIPLIDLRIKLGLECREYTRETCIVVVEVPGSREKLLIGVIVDSVHDVIDVVSAEIDDIPSFGVRINTAFLSGLANTKNGLSLLMNIEHVLSHDELLSVEHTNESTEETLFSEIDTTSTAPEKKDAAN